MALQPKVNAPLGSGFTTITYPYQDFHNDFTSWITDGIEVLIDSFLADAPRSFGTRHIS
jgi:hypothetical protein